MSDALSRFPRADIPQQPVDDPFRDDPSPSSPLGYAGPRRPVLDGVLLDHLTPASVEGQRAECWFFAFLKKTADPLAENFLSEAPFAEFVQDSVTTSSGTSP